MLKLLILISLSVCISVYECKSHPLLLVSFDGFRADKLDEFLSQNPNSNFSNLIKQGVKADYMIPSFPSLTFPNHWTLVTGRYVESHGIVGNVVYFPEYNVKVRLGTSRDTKFWNKTDPIWLTAKKQGKKTASSYWVGSEAILRQPDIYLSFGESLEPIQRIDMLINWFKKFDLDLACLYFDQPDSTGHSFGPNSEQYAKKIVEMDSLLGYLILRLTEENLLDNLNIVVVSDHGMAKLDNDFQIPLDEHLDINKINLDKTVFATVSNIYPISNDVNLIDEIVANMSRIPNLQVFKKSQVPEKFYYSKNDLIAPIVAIASESYQLGEKRVNLTNPPGGAHGYNNTILSMRAIFLAFGPSFKPNTSLRPFQNINVYSLLCKLMEINCNPSNGTIDVFEGVFSPASTLSFNQFFYECFVVLIAYLFYF